MQLQVVNIEDVYPDPNNPRKNFEGIEELAASFELNTERPGEPFTPPILVRDGGIFYIVDGERRYRALKLRKATKFTANVAESMDEANVMMAMLATDDKQPLSELERSRGVQQMLLLGVEPEKVAAASKLKAEDIRKVKQAREQISDAAEDMTIERLLVIQEFADDEEVVERLTNCREADWRHVAEAERRWKAERIRSKAIEETLKELGFKVSDSNTSPAGYLYAFRGKTAEHIKDSCKNLDASKYLVLFCEGGLYADFYEKAEGKTVDPAKEEEKRKIEEMRALIKDEEKHRHEWLLGCLKAKKSLPELGRIASIRLLKKYNYLFGDLNKRFGYVLSVELNETVLMLGLFSEKKDIGWTASHLACGVIRDYSISYLGEYINEVNAYIADGYQPFPEEAALYELITNMLNDACKEE